MTQRNIYVKYLLFNKFKYSDRFVVASKSLRCNVCVIRVCGGHFATIMCLMLRISNKYGSVTALKQWPNQTYMSQKAGLQINFSASLVKISYVNSSIKLNFNQPANVKLKPRRRCVFWIYVMLFQNSDTFHKEFVPS
jgi:hypothetical protein